MSKKTVDVGAVIDSARFFPTPFVIALMMIVIMLTDGIDLGTMGRVATHLVKDWGITRGDLGPINTAGLIGMAVGSVGMGWLGDIIGRKRAYIACLIFLFAGSLLCGFAQNLTQLTIFRAVTGLGLGGVTPLAATLMSEWAPKRVRSTAVAFVVVAVPLGGALAGYVERWLVPDDHAWRAMFFFGAAVPLALFAVFSFLLPESPKFMAQHPKRHPALARALNRLVGEKRFDGTEEFFVQEGKKSKLWFTTIWNRQYALATLFIWIAFSVNSFVLYVFTNYLQTLLDTVKLMPGLSSKSADFFFYGAFFGSIGGAALIGWFGSRWVGAALALLGVAASIVIGLTVSPDQPAVELLALCLLAGSSVNGMQAFMYAVTAHSYPTEIRGSAVGMAQTVSRVGAVLSPMVATYYFDMKPVPPLSAFLWFIAACAVVTTVSFFLIPSHIPAGGAGKGAGEESPRAAPAE
jgi:AAHS family 4-hydroxybenzoate transporter-like MFS transporter